MTLHKLLAAACLLVLALAAAPAFAQTDAPPPPAPAPGTPGSEMPSDLAPQPSSSDFWREIRQGEQFSTSLPNDQGAVMIQSEGENWRALRNGPLKNYTAYGVIGVVAVLALFFAIRGRIKIDSGWSGILIQRFTSYERFIHWLTATAFVVLMLTGLNLLFGRYFLPELMGAAAYATMTQWGKYAHNYFAFAFMLGFTLMLLRWLPYNIPNRHDLIWLARGGGLFGGGHPPAKKFNAGQKILFWSVVLGGISVSLSGIALMFPYSTSFFADTAVKVNAIVGTSLPTDITPLQEQQLNAIWHGIVGMLLSLLIIAHIYIGSIGMQGAFDAMGSGQVDLNWAREHHGLWVKEMEKKGAVGDD